MTSARVFGPRWAAVAAGWWLSYGLLAVSWSVGGPGWPYGERGPAVQAGALLVGVSWLIANQALCVVGVMLTAFAARACRRSSGDPAPPRWSGAAVALAIGAPLVYAAIRCAWALGLPIGATEEFLAPYTVTGARITEAIIAGFATGGALLTVGLVRPWGEIFPRWLPGLVGRRVPASLAVVPATIVAVMLTAAGLSLSLSRGLLAMAIGLTPATPSGSLQNWGAWLAAPLWAIWGVALGTATYAYHRRRATGLPQRATP